MGDNNIAVNGAAVIPENNINSSSMTEDDAIQKTSAGVNQSQLPEDEQLKIRLNNSRIFSVFLDEDTLNNIKISRITNSSNITVTQIEIKDDSKIGVDVIAAYKALSVKNESSEFDVKIGDNKVHYKIDGKTIHADMSGMSKEVAASDDALKITLTDADTKYGKVSIQIDPNTMNPALVFDTGTELTQEEMQLAREALSKIYGNSIGNGKNASMSIKGDGNEIEFKSLPFMSKTQIEQNKQAVKSNSLPSLGVTNANELSVSLPGFGVSATGSNQVSTSNAEKSTQKACEIPENERATKSFKDRKEELEYLLKHGSTSLKDKETADLFKELSGSDDFEKVFTDYDKKSTAKITSEEKANLAYKAFEERPIEAYVATLKQTEHPTSQSFETREVKKQLINIQENDQTKIEYELEPIEYRTITTKFNIQTAASEAAKSPAVKHEAVQSGAIIAPINQSTNTGGKDNPPTQNIDNKTKLYNDISELSNSTNNLINTQNETTQHTQNQESRQTQNKTNAINTNRTKEKVDLTSATARDKIKYLNNLDKYDITSRQTILGSKEGGQSIQKTGDFVAVHKGFDYARPVNRGTHTPQEYRPGSMTPAPTPNVTDTSGKKNGIG